MLVIEVSRFGGRRRPDGGRRATPHGREGRGRAREALTGREFFPELISGPFHHGLVVVFAFATVLAGLAALASALRGVQRRTG
jgi:hypothetical protein